MSAAINPKRLWSVPERPLSADPASTTSSSIRPSFSSFSSSFSSLFPGRHSRTNSTSTQGSANPVRPASAAPQQQTKWVPRPTTPGTANQSRSSRHRSTSSASAAAAALPSSTETPVPPLPSDSQHRRSPALPAELTADAGPDAWRVSIQRAAASRYHRRVRAAEHDLRERLRAAAASGANNAVSSHRRDSLSSGSSASSGSLASSTSEGRLTEEPRLRAAHDQTMARLRNEYEEDVRNALREEARRRGVPPFPHPPNPTAPVLAPSRSRREEERKRGVVVEDDGGDEWTWRPEEHGQRPPELADKDKWKEAVRQEQQVIWEEAIKRTSTPGAAQQQQQLSSSAGRKVHFAPEASPSAETPSNSTPPSAAPLSATQTQPPSLPRTPHTAINSGYPSRPLSAHPSVTTAASAAIRPLSPAVSAPGVRPGSARPASPAYTRWIPSTGAGSTTATSGLGPNPGHAMSGRTASTPIAIPGRGSGVNAGDSNGSAGKDGTGSMGGGGGSWRDWSVPGHVSGMRRDAPTPSPTATNGSSHGHPYVRTASNSNLHSSVYGRTPSSGNLYAMHGRTPSNSNLHSGTNLRRALTPGTVSSASQYARQRTASATHRAPSVPPVLPSAAGRDREYMYGKDYTSMREKDKERERRTKTGVVDDRELDDAARSQTNPYSNYGRTRPVRATDGLGSRQSSNRSALVEEDAPAPEGFSSSPAPAMRGSSSRQSQKPGNEDEDEDAPRIPKVDKGKGKARAPPSPVLASSPLGGKRGNGKSGIGGMYQAQLEDFASLLRRDLGISAEA